MRAVEHPCSDPANCGVCEWNRRQVGGAKKPRVAVRKPLPVVCAHLAPLTVRVAGSSRSWQRCNAGHGSTAKGAEGLVCGCSTPGQGVWRLGHECGPRCPGFTQTATVVAGHSVTIGNPPTITPTSDRLVCTVAVGPSGEAMLKATGPMMERYAHKVGADFYAVTGDPLNPGYPLADKFRLHHLTPHYQRLLFVDADALIHPDAPDLFAEVPEGVAIRDDAGEATNREYLSAAYRKVVASQGETGDDGGRVLNSGVVLWGEDSPEVWTPPVRPLPDGLHVAEQCWVQRNVSATGSPVTHLSRHWNYQWWTDRRLSGVDAVRPWVLHMAGMSQMAQVPGWNLDPNAVRSAVLIAGAWAAGRNRDTDTL